MKQKIQHFMMGRYGADQLGQLFLGCSVIFLLISLFTRLDIFYILALGLMGYEYYRMMSKHVERRFAENQKGAGLQQQRQKPAGHSQLLLPIPR